METKCFECGQPADVAHHVVPQSRGGTKTVPLCNSCHSLVHDARLFSSSNLISEGRKLLRLASVQKQIVDLFDDGVEKTEIARMVGVSRNSVYRVLEKYGRHEDVGEGLVEVFTPEMLSRIIEARKSNKPWTKICEELEISYTNLYRVLNEHGLRDNLFAHRSRKSYRTMDDDKVVKAKELRAEGKSWQQVADELEVNIATLYRWKIPQGQDHLRSRLTPETIDLAKSLRNQGKTWNEIAEQVGVTASCLSQRFGKEFKRHRDLPECVALNKSGRYVVVVSVKRQRFFVGAFEELEVATKAAEMAIALRNSGCSDKQAYKEISGKIV